jgi:hypothetical protein
MAAPLSLFQPRFDAANANIRLGAGIVGFGNPDGTLTVYFESNRFDESSLHKWENKARKAYDRMVAGAPTVSKAKLNASMLEQIGIIDGMGIHLKQPEAPRAMAAARQRAGHRASRPGHAVENQIKLVKR